jgi:hypothetical protein
MVGSPIKGIRFFVLRSLLIEDLEIIRYDKFYLSYLSSIQFFSYYKVREILIIYKDLY